MKIALLVDWHSPQMGYSDNFLPKALAALGHEVHLIASNAQVYFNYSGYKDIFEKFLGPGLVECGTKRVDGYTLHRLPCSLVRNRVRIAGLQGKLNEIKPEIVQVGDIYSWCGYEALLRKPWLGFKFFLECHVHASVFSMTQEKVSIRNRIYWPIYARTMGALVNAMTEKCYAISTDAGEIAERYFGIDSAKVVVRSLGVDTELFAPRWEDLSNWRNSARSELGIPEEDVLCVYTGRLAPEKGPLILAKAIGKLRQQGHKVHALFVGFGAQPYMAEIASYPGVTLKEFVPVQALSKYYQISDIGVWPKQESTSQLDALSCGLPLILSNRIQVLERVDGCGLLYEEDSSDDLAAKIEMLLDPVRRRQLGSAGSRKIKENYSWSGLAKEYEQDYQRSLAR